MTDVGRAPIEHATELITACMAKDAPLTSEILMRLSAVELAFAAAAAAGIAKALLDHLAQHLGEDPAVLWQQLSTEAARRYLEEDPDG